MEQAGDGDRRGTAVPRSLKCVFAQGHRGQWTGLSGDCLLIGGVKEG